jgi:predicted PolB exonuclease-like 3'-5' exonuclease
MQIVIDIETIPDQTKDAVKKIAETLTVKAPSSYNKPDFIKDLNLDQSKYKSVSELRELWVQELGEPKKIEQAKEQWLKTSFDGGRGQIACIVIKIIDEDLTIEFSGDEKNILTQFWNTVNEKTELPFFIAHNAKFDLPFLWHRSVVNNVKSAPKFNPHGRHGNNHFCTMEAWAGFGGRISLNNLADILGEGSKTDGMDGSQVWPEYQAGNIDKIVSYCVDDVELTSRVYKRLRFMG